MTRSREEAGLQQRFLLEVSGTALCLLVVANKLEAVSMVEENALTIDNRKA